MMELTPTIARFRPTLPAPRKALQGFSNFDQRKKSSFVAEFQERDDEPILSFDSIFDAEILNDDDSYSLKSYKKTLLLKTYSFQYLDLYI